MTINIGSSVIAILTAINTMSVVRRCVYRFIDALEVLCVLGEVEGVISTSFKIALLFLSRNNKSGNNQQPRRRASGLLTHTYNYITVHSILQGKYDRDLTKNTQQQLTNALMGNWKYNYASPITHCQFFALPFSTLLPLRRQGT